MGLFGYRSSIFGVNSSWVGHLRFQDVLGLRSDILVTWVCLLGQSCRRLVGLGYYDYKIDFEWQLSFFFFEPD